MHSATTKADAREYIFQIEAVDGPQNSIWIGNEQRQQMVNKWFSVRGDDLSIYSESGEKNLYKYKINERRKKNHRNWETTNVEQERDEWKKILCKPNGLCLGKILIGTACHAQ